MNGKNEEKLMPFWKKSLFFGFFLAVFCMIVILILFSIRNSAVQNLTRLSTSIPLPSHADILYSNNGFIYNSIGCYHGYSVIFIGSNMEVNEIIKSYRQYFNSKGWRVDPSEGDEIYFGEELISVNETDIWVFGNDEIEGYYIDVLLCDHMIDCANVDPNFNDREEIDNFGNLYKTTFWLVVRYKPRSVRYNLCDCCSGG